VTDSIESLGNVRARGIFLLAVAFVAGAVAGAAVYRLVQPPQQTTLAAADRLARLRDMRRGEGEEGGRRVDPRNEGIPVTLWNVDLTDEQRAKVRAIMARMQPTADSLMRSVRPTVFALDLQMRQEAMCVLTPTQREAWMAWRRRENLSMEEGGEMMKLVTSNACPPETKAKP
jgi:Spy/CpxP family protein refolding chaperone